MSLLRDFCINVVPTIPRSAAAAVVQAQASQTQTATLDEDVSEQKAEAAAYKAEIMKRLSALLIPYKEAIAEVGSDRERLQAQLSLVKTCIGKSQYAQA